MRAARLNPLNALRWALLFAALLLALAHASGVWPLRFVEQLEFAIGDTRLRAAMPHTLDPRIVVVDIDEKSLAEVGRWPWGRDRLAALTDELFARQHAAVVGFDMVFAEPDASSGLPALERLAAHDPAIAARLPALRPSLDNDALFAAALNGRAAVLSYYFTSDREGHRSGELPAPVFDAAALQGRRISFMTWDGYGASLPQLVRAAPSAGYFNTLPDSDGVVRTVPLIAEHEGRYYEALSLAMLRRFTGAPTVRPGLPARPGLGPDYNGLDSIQLEQGGQRLALPVDARVGARVPYRGDGGPRGGSFGYVSASDVLQGRLPADQLKGKLVLVGSTAPGAYDLRATPVAAVFPGVEVHANLLSGLLDGRLPVAPDWARGAEVLQLLLSFVVLALLLTRVRASRAVLITLALVAGLVGFNLWAYQARGLVLPLASALLLTALIFVGSMSWGYIVVGRARRSLKRLFGAYVPPELVAEMARDPQRYDMRAENRVLTVMFCDMRNFTRVSEALSPEDLRALINRFFSSMTAVIGAHRGTLDKYIGDALMAFWGAPLHDAAHAENAVRAALAMARALDALNAELRQRKLPEIGVGIGINTGLVCVGDMGSNIRRSYTVMGDAVNLASRIEALTRHYGVQLLVGQSTRDATLEAMPAATPGAAQEATPAATPETARERLRWVEVDRVRVKGKQQSVTLFTPAPEAAPGAPSFDEEMRLWVLALGAYRLQHWDEAQAGLDRLHDRFPASPLTILYRQLAERLAQHRRTPPPPDWDGVHSFESK
jgi:adenylate cyclase